MCRRTKFCDKPYYKSVSFIVYLKWVTLHPT
uniref:Uncharacterized protein n=1 Tax=Arundo donax TaxID=35708 RepID=A0A0A9BJK9_ARUDO